MRLFSSSIILFLFIFPHYFSYYSSDNDRAWYQKARLKDSCLNTYERTGRIRVRRCWYFEGMKSWFRRTSISWFPEKTKKWNLTELTTHCNNYYVCMENTNCYKDYVLFETLDRCSHDAFNIGPMSFCEKKLREILKSSPDQLSNCVKEYLETTPQKKWTCESAKNTGDCLFPDVQKHCEPYIIPLFKEHQETRMYYLGCDGRLKFKDLDEGDPRMNSTTSIGESVEIP